MNKVIQFNDTEVIISKQGEEYVADYENHDGERKHISLGSDPMFLWEPLSKELGGDNTPTGKELLVMADEIYDKLPQEATISEVQLEVERSLFNYTRLFPAYIHIELFSIVDSRLWRIPENENARKKLCATATLDEWLNNAIQTKRVYRLTLNENYADQAVRIIGAYKSNGDYMLEFAILHLDDNEWESNETLIYPMSKCDLIHRKVDELPADYAEVLE